MGKASSLKYRQNIILARVGQLRPPHEAIFDLVVEGGRGRTFVYMKLVFIFREIIIVSGFIFLAIHIHYSPLNYFCASDNF
jgi:restriction endonuclease